MIFLYICSFNHLSLKSCAPKVNHFHYCISRVEICKTVSHINIPEQKNSEKREPEKTKQNHKDNCAFFVKKEILCFFIFLATQLCFTMTHNCAFHFREGRTMVLYTETQTCLTVKHNYTCHFSRTPPYSCSCILRWGCTKYG